MSGEWGVALQEIALPEFEVPRHLPVTPAATYERRVAEMHAAMSERGRPWPPISRRAPQLAIVRT